MSKNNTTQENNIDFIQSDYAHNDINHEILNRNDKNSLNSPITKFRNLDIFCLENNILDLSDDHSFLYSQSNFNFLDHRVDNILDNMFVKSDILITNKNNEDCNLCFDNLNKKYLKINNCNDNVSSENNLYNNYLEDKELKENIKDKSNDTKEDKNMMLN